MNFEKGDIVYTKKGSGYLLNYPLTIIKEAVHGFYTVRVFVDSWQPCEIMVPDVDLEYRKDIEMV